MKYLSHPTNLNHFKSDNKNLNTQRNSFSITGLRQLLKKFERLFSNFFYSWKYVHSISQQFLFLICVLEKRFTRIPKETCACMFVTTFQYNFGNNLSVHYVGDDKLCFTHTMEFYSLKQKKQWTVLIWIHLKTRIIKYIWINLCKFLIQQYCTTNWERIHSCIKK